MTTWEVMKNIIRKILKETGVKQGFLARKHGYNERKFSALINGHKLITDEDIIKFCKAFNVTPNELIILNDIDYMKQTGT